MAAPAQQINLAFMFPGDRASRKANPYNQPWKSYGITASIQTQMLETHFPISDDANGEPAAKRRETTNPVVFGCVSSGNKIRTKENGKIVEVLQDGYDDDIVLCRFQSPVIKDEEHAFREQGLSCPAKMCLRNAIWPLDIAKNLSLWYPDDCFNLCGLSAQGTLFEIADGREKSVFPWVKPMEV